MSEVSFDTRVRKGFWVTMAACVLYALAAWLLTR